MALEFAEFLRNFVSIDIQADLDSVTEEVLLAELVPAGASVLEIVRGESVSATLMAKDCSVDLIDFGQFDAAEGFSAPPTPRPAYAVVVLSDVLGYARDPVRLLRQCRGLLADGGFVLSAMPNFGYGALRLALVSGAYDEFAREQESNPRLHFFTHELIGNLLSRAGYRSEETLRRVVPWDADAQDDRYAGLDDAILAQIRRDPEHATFSFVVKTLPIVHVLPSPQDMDESLPGLRKQLDAARAELASAEALNEELRDAGRALREEASAQRQRARLAERLQRELDAVLSDLSAAFAQRDDVLVQVHSADLALARIEQERDAVRSSLQKAREEFEGVISELKRGNAELLQRAEKAEGTALELANELLQSTKVEIQQLSDLIDVVQRSRFWRVKHFFRGLRRLLVR